MVVALASLIHKLLPEEFVIDERPLEVLDWEALQTRLAREGGAAVPAYAQYLKPQKPADLLAQLADMMVQQVVLADRARQLEQARPSDDEFGRFARGVLPFLDNLDHLLDLARENPPSEESTGWLGEVERLYFRLVRQLEEHDLRFINSAGKPVDLEYHEVIEYRRTDQHPHNTVIKELRKAVVFRGRLIRDAKVVVACNNREE